jgi:predicted lipoprotein with Yx(FWY)xxD motif
MTMKRLLISLATASAAVVLAACGSNGSSGTSNTASGGSTATVAAKQVDGVGNVLVDSSGRTLYSSDEEAKGQILCTGACTAFWAPLTADGTPMAASGVAQLGVIDRPDGSAQVTADGRPLYTFKEDAPGEIKGNDFSDDFGSQHFTWHAVLANGTVASGTSGNGTTPGAGTNPGGYGY